MVQGNKRMGFPSAIGELKLSYGLVILARQPEQNILDQPTQIKRRVCKNPDKLILPDS